MLSLKIYWYLGNVPSVPGFIIVRKRRNKVTVPLLIYCLDYPCGVSYF
jgi:hypothetical protein